MELESKGRFWHQPGIIPLGPTLPQPGTNPRGNGWAWIGPPEPPPSWSGPESGSLLSWDVSYSSLIISCFSDCNKILDPYFIPGYVRKLRLGRRQAVRQRVLIPSYLGSNPSGPASFHASRLPQAFSDSSGSSSVGQSICLPSRGSPVRIRFPAPVTLSIYSLRRSFHQNQVNTYYIAIFYPHFVPSVVGKNLRGWGFIIAVATGAMWTYDNSVRIPINKIEGCSSNKS